MNRSFRIVDDPNSLIEPVDDDWNDEDDNYLHRLGVSGEEAPESIPNNPFHEPPFNEPWYAPHGLQRPIRNLPSFTGGQDIRHFYTDGINEISGMRTNRSTSEPITLKPTERVKRCLTHQEDKHGNRTVKEVFRVDDRIFNSFDEALDYISENRHSPHPSNPSKDEVQDMLDEVFDEVRSTIYSLKNGVIHTSHWDHIIERCLNDFKSNGYIDAFSWMTSPESFGKVLRLRKDNYVVRYEFMETQYGY